MKISSYCNFLHHDKWCILHNTLNNEIIRIDNLLQIRELDRLYAKNIFPMDNESSLLKEMLDKKMLVDENDNQEYTLANQAIGMLRENLKIDLMTTSDCDDDLKMSDSMFAAVVEFARQRISNYDIKGMNLIIRGKYWYKLIDLLQEFLQALKIGLCRAKCGLKASVHSDGVDMTAERFQFLYKMGVENFQITLNQFDKPYHEFAVSKEWLVSVENIKRIRSLNGDYMVVLRIFVNELMAENFEEIIIFLREAFKDDKRFSCNFVISEQLKLNYSKEKISQINEKIYLPAIKHQLKFEDCLRNSMNIGKIRCSATAKHSFVINYDGKIKKCISCPLGKPIELGEIKNGRYPKLNHKRLQWMGEDHNQGRCRQCCIYPLCTGKICPYNQTNSHYCDRMVDYYFHCLEYLYY